MDIGARILETTVCGDTRDAIAGGGSNVQTRDTRYHRNRDSSDSIKYFQSIVEAVGMIINIGSENSELLSNKKHDFRASVLARIVDCHQMVK